MRNPFNRRARTVRSGAIALACAAGALLALPAQAAWLVSDTRAQQILTEIRNDQRSGGSMYRLIDEDNKRNQPQDHWDETGHRAAYKPYQGKRNSDDDKFGLLANMTDFPARTMSHGVMEKCQLTTLPPITTRDLFDEPPVPSVSPTYDPVAEGNKICARTVALENLRYVEVRRMMNRIKARNDALKTMSDQRTAMNNAGAVIADTNNLQMFIADAQVEIMYSQALIAAYDSQINALNIAQDVNAKRAMDGPPKTSLSVLGATAARAGTLCAALSAFKTDSSDFNCGTIVTDLF